MTETEMITLFHQRYDDSSFTNDELGDDEVYLYLNLEVERFLNTRFTGNNIRKKSFEEDQKRIDDVRTLLVVGSEILVAAMTAGDEISNSHSLTLPADYRFYVKSYSKITKTFNSVLSTNVWLPNDVLRNNEIDKFTQTMFHTPIIDNPKVAFRSTDELTIIYDNDTTLVSAKVQYIKQPVKIASGVDCDLPDHTHEEIVEGAISLALETVESKRGQSEQAKLLTTE